MTPEGFSKLKLQEGFKSNIYPDSFGNKTIGYGTNLEEGITEEQGEALADIRLVDNRDVLMHFEWFAGMDPVRQDVVENMCYNMGLRKLLQFHNMISYLGAKNYSAAAKSMLASLWAKQVGKRATDLSSIMDKGVY